MRYLAIVVRFFYTIANPLRTAYWFVSRPVRRGVKCLIECEGKFLLVKLTYKHNLWTLPGGGVRNTETFQEAAVRETKEEVGIELSNPVKIGVYGNTHEYKKDTVEVFYKQVPSSFFKIDGIEIREAKWFAKDSLPRDFVSRARQLMSMYHNAKESGII